MKAIRFSQVLKWIGYATAILSLIAGIRETEKIVADHVAARRKVDSLLASESIQMRGRDYWSAWHSLEQASQVNPDSAQIREAQDTLAMEWLENIHVQENERFSDIAEKLEPVLTRDIASARTGQREADLLAHLGWSYFLRSREGVSGLDPAAAYGDAVKKDPDNAYAHAMWGHWILWNHGDVGEAEKHFSSALQSNRQRDYVRRLQLSALLNANDAECDREIIRVLNAIRKEQGSVDPGIQNRIFAIYYSEIVPGNAETQRFVNAVPPAEHVATFQWLFDKPNPDQSEKLPELTYLGVLQEAAGQRDEALAAYRSVRQQTEGHPGALLNMAESGVKRLSGK